MRCQSCGYALWNLSEPRCPECGRGFDVRYFRFQPGTVVFDCPLCGQEHHGGGEFGLPAVVGLDCEGCGQAIDVGQMRVRPIVNDLQEAEAGLALPLPWDERSQLGVARAWWGTFVLSLRRPTELGQRISIHCPFEDAVWFAITSHIIAWAAGLVALAVVALVTGLVAEAIGWVCAYTCIAGAAVLIWPAIATIIWALTVHAPLLLTGRTRSHIERTAAALCYAQGPIALFAFGVIPFLLALLIPAVFIAQIVIATRIVAGAQQVTVSRAFVACMWVPVLLAVGFVGLLVMV